MNASPNEVQMILDAIERLHNRVDEVRNDVSAMDRRINGRIRKLEQFRWQLVGGAAVLSLAAGMILRVATL